PEAAAGGGVDEPAGADRDGDLHGLPGDRGPDDAEDDRAPAEKPRRGDAASCSGGVKRVHGERGGKQRSFNAKVAKSSKEEEDSPQKPRDTEGAQRSRERG